MSLAYYRDMLAREPRPSRVQFCRYVDWYFGPENAFQFWRQELPGRTMALYFDPGARFQCLDDGLSDWSGESGRRVHSRPPGFYSDFGCLRMRPLGSEQFEVPYVHFGSHNVRYILPAELVAAGSVTLNGELVTGGETTHNKGLSAVNRRRMVKAFLKARALIWEDGPLDPAIALPTRPPCTRNRIA